jgi:hypothetical protein
MFLVNGHGRSCSQGYLVKNHVLDHGRACSQGYG